MKSITTIKHTKVSAPNDQDFVSQGIVAFQLVTFKINFFGSEIETTHDTKILKDGSQIVIGGCGYIKEGFVLN